MHLFLALYALSSQIGTARCELHFLEAKGTQFRAVGMSPDGNLLLAESGLAPGLSATIVRDGKPTTWKLANLDGGRLIGIDNIGTILAAANDRTMGVPIPSAVKVLNGHYRPIGDVIDRKLIKGGVYVHSIGGDGEVYGNIQMDGPWSEKLHWGYGIVWTEPEIKVLGSLADAPQIGGVVRTSRGVVGYASETVWRQEPSVRKFGMRGQQMPPFPVMFLDTGFVRMELPSGYRFGQPTAATPDGSLIVGVLGTVFDIQAPVVWEDESPTIPTFRGQTKTRTELLSVSRSGRFAVGRMVEGKRQHAVIWEKGKEIRLLTEIARERGILLPAGWHFTEAVAIDPAGDRVYGTAIDYRNRRRPFLLWINPRPIENRQ